MVENYDIIVAGGGISGAMAAIAAGREGKRVLLIERDGCLGGAATSGLVYPFARYLVKENDNLITVNSGLFTEMLNRLHTIDNYNSNDYVVYHDAAFNQETLKVVLDDMCIENNVDVLFHSFVSDVSSNNGIVNSVSVVNKSGTTSFHAKYFIDCTGDADLCYKAGCQYNLGREQDGVCQPMTMCFRIGNVNITEFEEYKNETIALFEKMQNDGSIKCPGLFITFNHVGEGVLHFNSTRVVNRSGINAFELSKAEQEGRQQVLETYKFLKTYAKGFENCTLLSSASSIGVRETRLVKCDYTLTADDILYCNHFEDSIACGAYLLDIHNPTGKGVELKELKGVYYHIPYRCITPVGFNNLFVAGRCISATHEAQGACRAMPICASVGEAAGIAATMCSEQGLSSRGIEIAELQQRIANRGGKFK